LATTIYAIVIYIKKKFIWNFIKFNTKLTKNKFKRFIYTVKDKDFFYLLCTKTNYVNSSQRFVE